MVLQATRTKKNTSSPTHASNFNRVDVKKVDLISGVKVSTEKFIKFIN